MTPHEASFRFYTRLRGRRRLSAVELQLRCVPPCVGRRSAGEAADSGEHRGHGGRRARCRAPFVLINASPDLRQQIIATPALHPRGLRASPIAAVVLTGGEVDQTAGLLTLRERGPFALYGTADTLSTLAANSIFSVLAADVVARHPIRAGTAFGLPGGIEAELFIVPGKAPLYLEGDNPALEAETEANVGIELRAAGARRRRSFPAPPS